ncbi:MULTISPECIES: P-loop ATPase, Sll1717 family [unclassified Sinorhizobium]|uniref:P-loop ATPase, Sll1717 family n=1 Tax=unclassified Sinorhizobium TaxID=2613772 RepID=UPI003524B203
MASVFVAYPSGNQYHSEMIEEACRSASTNGRKISAWSTRDTSGSPIAQSVESWIEGADAFVADVSLINANVTYELGYAIGLEKPTRLIRSTHLDFAPIKAVGLLDTLGYDGYDYPDKLRKILSKPDETNRWGDVTKNKEQPLFILQPPNPTDASLRLTSAVKKIARVKFRNFNPAEISRLNASEAYSLVLSSYGVLAFWVDGTAEEAVRNNQRAAFIYGVARGKGIPCRLIAHESQSLPLDLHDQAQRWWKPEDLDTIIADFRGDLADYQNEFVSIKHHDGRLLETLTCGDPVAENEATTLADHFLETDAFQRSLSGEANVLVGRKGSGKTAVFLQVRDISRANKENIVIDLIPDGYQLIKMKEFILDRLSFGTRKEVIAAFWEYVLWLEIAYKLLEKDELRALRDQRLFGGYQKLKTLFEQRVDTGTGDFSERLKRLSQNVVDRFRGSNLIDDELHQPDSSKVLEAIYGQDVRTLRETVLDYLRLKGFVLFLFDNLDRFWTPGGFTDDDAMIVVGLTESMQEISRKFRRKNLDFRWGIFVRSDVYEFLIRGMADYGKLAVQSLEWSDRSLMKQLFEQRLRSSAIDIKEDWATIWSRASVATVAGRPVLDFLIDGSLMRPRYIIRLFETARRRAITFSRGKIAEEDYLVALKELGWQVLEDLDREIADLVPKGSELLFEIVQQREHLTASKLRYIASKELRDADSVNKLIDVMLWNGSLGVVEGEEARYIFDVGYKRQYLATLLRGGDDVALALHPTLVAALTTN